MDCLKYLFIAFPKLFNPSFLLISLKIVKNSFWGVDFSSLYVYEEMIQVKKTKNSTIVFILSKSKT